jgi:ATP-binding cassette subfamily F protein uup
MTPIFYIKDGDLSFADKTVLENLELYISKGDRVCLVGRNGCGKSSLMKVIEGEYELDNGEMFKDPSVSIGYLKQDMKLELVGNIYNFVLSAFEDPQGNKFHADIILKQLEINGDMDLRACSGGQLRRVCLAKVLITQPDILLLDEPTNHLDIKIIEWLEGHIKNYPGAVICISHDRTFQEHVSNKVWWIDRGRLRKSNKGFKYYDEWREEIIASEEAVLRKMNRKLEVEQNWLHGGITARRKRNQKRLASLHHLRQTLRAHQSKLKTAKDKLQIELAEEMKKTKFIVDAEGISYNFPGNKLFDNFTFKVKKGEKIGVIGPNGAGKSTLIKILTKELEPVTGKVKHGTNIDITYFDQHRTELIPQYSIKRTLCPGGGDQVFLQDRSMHVAAYLKKFMFDPKTLENKVATLSGGEANRLLLAKALVKPGNFFILDEPTNDLDMDSLEMLLEILADYKGTLIIVSHDRDFLERLVTRTLVFTGEGIVDLYGGYEDYLKYYKKEDKVIKVIKPTAQVPQKKKPPQKLSYKYARLLEVLPDEIHKLEEQIKELEQLLAQPNLYQENSKKFSEYSQLLQDIKDNLDSKIEQWVEVESMQEELTKP